MDFYPVPDPEFCKKLYNFDKMLQLNFDSAQGVWSIWERSPYDGSISHVMNVVEDDGTYAPLDDRVFKKLRVNRYYSKHRDKLVELLVDKPQREAEKREAAAKIDIEHLCKDMSLKKQFNKFVEKIKSVDKSEWMTPKKLKDLKTNQDILTADGKPVMYVPHKSLLEDSSDIGDREV